MVEQTPTPAPNVVDFVDYQLQRKTGFANALKIRSCRHCGAALGEGESEDDCSSKLISCDRPSRIRLPRNS
jgi:hypothetical protein